MKYLSLKKKKVINCPLSLAQLQTKTTLLCKQGNKFCKKKLIGNL
jgi:hypothetical protein